MSQVVSFAGFTPAARYDDIAWETVRVEEAPTSVGAWTVIDTITLDPVDTNPADPGTRNLTTENASDDPDLWYRFTFVDGDGGTGRPSTPVQNATSTSFASAEDFAERFGQTLTSDEADRVDALLGRVAGLIQDEAGGQTITLVNDDVLTMPGTNDERIPLPQRPVVSVASVTLDGTELVEGTDWYLDGDQIVRLGGGSFVSSLGQPEWWGSRGFGTPRQTLEITYSHGYDPVPETVKAMCLEAVVRVWVNPGAVAQERVGDTSTLYHYAPEISGLTLSKSERRSIRRLFGRTAKSITIGG